MWVVYIITGIITRGFMRSFFLLCFVFGLGSIAQEKKPNIVFILADDMNRDSWGIYGNKDCKTPNIDRIGSQGLVFENLYASVAMCAPFRQELYSGRSPWHGNFSKPFKIDSRYQKPTSLLEAIGLPRGSHRKNHVGPSEAYPLNTLEASKEQRW